jgi:hypothetical protein
MATALVANGSLLGIALSVIPPWAMNADPSRTRRRDVRGTAALN